MEIEKISSAFCPNDGIEGDCIYVGKFWTEYKCPACGTTFGVGDNKRETQYKMYRNSENEEYVKRDLVLDSI